MSSVFQVQVTYSPGMFPVHSVVLADRAEAERFVRQPDIWWYCYVLDDETPWRKGGAWTAREPDPVLPYDVPEKFTDLADASDDDDDEGRW